MSMEILGPLFVGAFLSGLIPVVNAELLVTGAAALAGPGTVLVVAAVSTLGQMVSKALLFGLARWSPSHLPKRARGVVARAAEKLRARGGAVGGTIFISALTGFPPFYGISLASGALGVSATLFVGLGTAGRLIRFAALAWGASHLGLHPSGDLTYGFLPSLGAGG
jgi:membrane protein YqaA with SNARE-associated domain